VSPGLEYLRLEIGEGLLQLRLIYLTTKFIHSIDLPLSRYLRDSLASPTIVAHAAHAGTSVTVADYASWEGLGDRCCVERGFS
jgi:hypothetical protein